MEPTRVAPPAGVRTVLLLLLACSLCLPALAKESWVEVRSPNFTVISNSGDKEARRVADQFEQLRELFHSSFPQMRLDLGKPLIILAVKNEDSLKLLLPGFWEVKGHMHPAGLYAPGEDRHFVALRTNVEGDYPYEVVYHEYTHAIMNLNYQGLPLWLSEGLAELFGFSMFHDKDVEYGKVPASHLQALQENRLIPIDVLLTADHTSPYYNEQNRAGVFYAESWAIVHYLLMDPEARKRQLLSNFLKGWEASGDQVQAAQAAFGDLKRFSQAMEAYSRQKVFYVGKVTTPIHGDPKSYASRDLPAAELAANRALFYIHTRRPKEARASVEEALQADAKLPLAYEARGLLAYSQEDFPASEAAFSRAIELNSSSYFVYYFDAQARLRRGVPAPEDRAEVAASLEKAVAMNPQFAAAYAALASVYSMQPETQDKAIQAGVKAVKLEPGNLNYAINYGYVLLNAGKVEDAKILIPRIQQAAKTPQDKVGADMLAAALQSRENYEKQQAEFAARAKREAEEEAAERKTPTATSGTATLGASASSPGSSASAPSKHANEPEYAVEGVIASAECNPDSSGKVILTVNHVGMRFVYTSLKELQVVGGSKPDSEPPACSEWKGKRARFYFYRTKIKTYTGELDTIQFF